MGRSNTGIVIVVYTRRWRALTSLVHSPLTRRTFLAGAAGAGVVALTGNWRQAIGAGPAEVARGGVFAQSVASGQPVDRRHHAVDEALPARAPGPDPVRGLARPRLPLRHRAPQRRRRAPAATSRSPRACAAPGCAPASSTTTASSPATARRPSGASAPCARPTPTSPCGSASSPARSTNGGFYTAHAALAEEQDLDVVVCLGDYVYERNYYESAARTDTTGAEPRRRRPDAPRVPRQVPALPHGLEPPARCARRTRCSRPGTTTRSRTTTPATSEGDATPNHRVPFLERRANGYQAFFEHMPLVRDTAAPDRIYGQATLGRHAELFVLDQRRYRSDQPCGDPIAAALPGGRGRRPHDARRGAEGVVQGRARGLARDLEARRQPADGDGARGRAARRVVHLRLVGRLQGRAARAAGVHPRPRGSPTCRS